MTTERPFSFSQFKSVDASAIGASSPKQSSQLDHTIAPEVKDDTLYRRIMRLAREEKINSILEIGSSSGGGSTEAFVLGAKENPNRPTLFCMEVSAPRFNELQNRWGREGFVRCYNVSSVAPEEFPSKEKVTEFYKTIPTALNQYPLEQVLGWLQQDLNYIRDARVPTDGITRVKRENGVTNFDVVFIDGSEFTGEAEFSHIYGAKFIILDDVNAFKNYANRKRLLADPLYELVDEDLTLRSGYSIFKKRDKALPIHIFTIVLNGEPFIRHHIDEFAKLSGKWHWHIIEGVAALRHDTAWSVPNGGRVSDEMHRNGLSNDGTTEYLNELASKYPGQVTIYRPRPGEFWDGKVAMVSAPLKNITEECLLLEVDSDELWKVSQIEKLREMFRQDPSRTGAYFHCHYFVGPKKYVPRPDLWATCPLDWPRAWAFKPGMMWRSHEPAALVDSEGRDVIKIKPFSRDETMTQGLVFEHFSYAIPAQIRFKEIYYGYKNAMQLWENLQRTTGQVNPRDYLPWADKDGIVEDWGPERGPTLADKYLAPALPKKMKIAGIDNVSGKDLTQIDGESDFARAIRELITSIRPTKIIETGTYLGQGTTRAIASALKETGNTEATFFSIEINPNNLNQAAMFLNKEGLLERVRLLQGLSLQRRLLPNESDIHRNLVENPEFADIYVDHKENERAKLYHAETNFQGGDEDLLKKTLDVFQGKPDFVLLDSGGHIGGIEFDYLLSNLKGPCYIALDDIYHVKHHRSFKRMQQDSRFKILRSSKEKFGFCLAHFDPQAGAASRANSESSKEMKVTSITGARNILWVRPDSIGDAVLASSMLMPIKSACPQAQIHVVCQEHLVNLYMASPAIATVTGFNRDKLTTDPSYQKELEARIRDIGADVCLNSVYSRDTVADYLSLISGAGLRVAWKGTPENIDAKIWERNNNAYTTLIEGAEQVTELERHQVYLSSLGIPSKNLAPVVWVAPSDEDWAESFLESNSIDPARTVILFAGAQYSVRDYAGYGEALRSVCLDQGFSVVALGSALDEAINEKMLLESGAQRRINLSGKTTLRQAAALMKLCRLAFGAETGLAHIACAVNIPNVVLLGGGHFGRFMPYSNTTTVVALPLECFNCNWKCKLDAPHCVKAVSPKALTFAIKESLKKVGDQPTVIFDNLRPGKLPVAKKIPSLGISSCQIIDLRMKPTEKSSSITTAFPQQ